MPFLRTSLSAHALLALLAIAGSTVACGDDAAEDGGAGGSASTTSTKATTVTSSTASNTSASTGMAGQPAFESVTAPDRTHFALKLDRALPLDGAVLDASKVVITSDRGPVEVTEIQLAPGGDTLTVTTKKQKLGVTYQIQVLDGLGVVPGSRSCLAADTATFWADDFGAPNFEQYELVARRVAVGEHVVLYLEEGMEEDQADIQETVSVFDEKIFPIETATLHAAPDRDDNGKILLLGLDGGNYYGGYFTPFNIYTEEEAEEFGFHSNAMDMVFINTLFGWSVREVVTHEFAHLLYQEQHPTETDYNAYHNEGLAECAVHLVHGANDTAASYYFNDFGGDLRGGKSLIQWEYGNYSQYAQAYVYWTYVASRLGGVSAYGDLFKVSGDPADIDAYLQAQLGQGITSLQLDWLAAMRVGAPAGKYGFAGLLVPQPPQSLSAGGPVSLAPFAAAYFDQTQNGVTPSGAGPDIRFIGISGAGTVGETAPFDAAGGVIAAVNTEFDPEGTETESTGIVGPGPGAQASEALIFANAERLRRHPPPLDRRNMAGIKKWRDAVIAGSAF